MSSYFSRKLEGLRETINKPEYESKKQQEHQILQGGSLISTAILVASATFSIFGLALTLSGDRAAVGFPILMVTLPLCYLSYNSLKSCEILKRINNNPQNFKKGYGLVNRMDKEKIKQELVAGTVCFEWLAGVLAENYFYSKNK